MLYLTALCSDYTKSSPDPPVLRFSTGAPGPSLLPSAPQSKQLAEGGGTQGGSLSSCGSTCPFAHRVVDQPLPHPLLIG